MNRYKPGSSFRVSLTSLLTGLYTDPSNSVVTMFLPDKSSTAGTPIKDSTGLWHADFLIPATTPPGTGYYRWQSSGAAISQNALEEERFVVEPLDF
jgi:hypothetical protein